MPFIFSFSDTDDYFYRKSMNILTENWMDVAIVMESIFRNKHIKFLIYWDFPGGAVVKNPPANAGHTGSSPGPERSHMPRSN